MSASNLRALIEQLQSLPADDDTAGDTLTALEQREPRALVDTRRRCALCRRFDSQVFDLVTSDIAERPSLASFVERHDVHPLGPGWWTLDDHIRTRLLDEWQTSAQIDWKQWNQRLGDFFAERLIPDAHLDALYHFAASPSPAAAVPLFREWYREADERFDLAQCHALLEILRLQQEWRGSELSREWRKHTKYHSARLLFADDYYKTGSYFQRAEPLEALHQVVDPARLSSGGPWIFHLHATGGTGKTMFLRWLVARHLVPGRVPCARVDFDDFALEEVMAHPLQLFVRIVEQWSVQVHGSSLTSLLEKLRIEQRIPGWHSSLFDELRRQLVHADIETPVVVILDTLEEATLSASRWLSQCITVLRDIHQVFPSLRLILSGRYDLNERAVTLPAGECVVYELPRFTEDEAHAYLEQRGIAAGDVRDAIVARCATADEGGESDAARAVAGSDPGHNPFKLAIFAEIALNRRTALTAEGVKALPRADIGYLLERVVLRIKSQPLRWVIRYGVIARHLTQEFIEEVLLPPMRLALRGVVEDAPQVGLPDTYADVWKPEPGLAEAVTSTEIWEQLKAYARKRGWISLVISELTRELRFHPEVVQPMRALLRRQRVHDRLQARAVEFFEGRSRIVHAGDGERQARQVCEAIYHRFQLDGPAARDYWLQQVASVAQSATSQAMLVAGEITGRDYADGGRIPRQGVTTAETLAAAHVRVADLALQAAGIDFFVRQERWKEFSHSIELAEAIEADLQLTLVPRLLRVIRDASADASDQSAIARLHAAIALAPTARERVLLEIHLAARLAEMRAAEASLHYRKALTLLDDGLQTGVRPIDIHLALAAHYHRAGAHAAVVEAHRQARLSAGDNANLRARVLEEQVAYAIGTKDLATAASRLEELRALPVSVHRSPASEWRLQAALLWARQEPLAAMQAALRAAERATIDLDRAESLERQGDAHALLFAFGAALSAWEQAAAIYGGAGQDQGGGGLAEAGWCTLKSVRLQTLTMGNDENAGAVLDAVARLRSVRELRISTRLELLHVYSLLRTSQRGAAGVRYRQLLDQAESWSSALRAEMMLFGLLFGLFDSRADSFEEVLSAVADVQPATRRTALLDWAEYATAPVDVPEDVLPRLLPLFYGPKVDSGGLVSSYVRRADLCRVLGRPDEAAAQLDRIHELWTPNATEGALMRWWQVNQARRRLGRPTDFAQLAARVEKSPLEHTGLHAAIRCEAADEALRAKDVVKAELFRTSGFEPLASELPSIWTRRISTLADSVTELRIEIELESAPPPPTAALRKSPHETLIDRPRNSGSLPGAPVRASDAALTPHRLVTIGPDDVPRDLRLDGPVAFDAIIDRLLDDWGGVAHDLSRVIRARLDGDGWKTLALDPAGALAALPWELVSAILPAPLIWRSVEKGGTRLAPKNMHRAGAVHLVGPELYGSEISFAATSGGKLEEIYARQGVRPSVSYNPHPDQLSADLSSVPTLVHIVAALREGASGVYLDFAPETADKREFELARSSDSPTAPLLNVSWLDRVLSRVTPPPFVVLDIARPENKAEAVRMLLLRNLFAAQLFALRHVRGVLTTGLAAPHERLEMAGIAITALLTGTLAGTVEALRADAKRRSAEGGAPFTLDFLLPRTASALWAFDAREQVFAPDGSRRPS